MVKKILIGVLALVVILAVAFFYLNNRNRTLSPPGNVELSSAGVSVSIPYSRPSVRGRLVFGSKEQKALQPYGEYWRLGANESTEITVNRDVNFNGQPLKTGRYRMYAVPGANEFDIALNSELGTWGAMEPDYELDVLHTKVPVEKLTVPIEQYTIALEPMPNGVRIVFMFSDTKFSVPVTTP